MQIICDKCGHIINKDKIVQGKIVEEYINIYGTFCSECGALNKSYKKTDITEKDNKIELLREQMREKLRKKLRRK